MPTENNIYLASGGTLALAFGTSATKIYGSIDADTVTIAAGVTAVLDGSFNRGNDVIKFAGNAASYSVVRVNASTVKITDALGTSVTIPVGSAGTQIQFADATRSLSGSSAGIVLGDQSVTAVATTLNAGTAPPAVVNYTLTVNTPSVTEGDSGTKTMSYKLTLDKAPTSAVTVNYETLDTGTATANDDFVPMAGTVTFAAGQTVAFVTVTVIGDTTVEAPETVKLQLSGSQLVASVEATGTIIDNEVAPVDPTSYIVTSGQIATADAQQVPITVNVGDTGNKTVTIQSDANAADRGVIINGNATVTVTAGAAGDIISVSGNANNTIDAGGGTGNDEVYIYGSGNNTVFVGSGDDKVFGGSGDDTIVVGAGNLGAADVFDGGAGVDTVRISGDGNVAIFGTLVGTNLRNIENLVLDGTSVTIAEDNLEAAIAAGLIKIEGHPGTSVITITGANAASIDLTGLNLTGIKELKVDVAGAGGAATLKLSAAQIAAIGTITEIAGETLTVNTTVAGYQALGTKAPNVTVTLTDTVQNLIAAGNTISGVTAVLGNATVAEAQSALSSGLTVSYTLVDTAANLALAPVAVFDSATAVTVTGAATAAQASAIQGNLAAANATLPGVTFDAAKLTMTVSDSASNVANYLTDTIDADGVTVTGGETLTVAQAAALYALNNAATYKISDTPANLAAAGNTAAMNSAAEITATGALTVAQVDSINAGTVKLKAGYALTDSFAAVTGAVSSVINNAGNLTVNGGALTVANAMVIEALNNTGTTSYTLSDAMTALLGASSIVVGGATSVAATDGSVTVAQLNQLVSKFGTAKVNDVTMPVADTLANLLTLSAGAVGEASAITISSGIGTVADIVALKALTGAKMPGTFTVTDSFANLSAALADPTKLALLDVAGATLNVSGTASAANIKALNDALSANAGGKTAVDSGYTLSDSAANLTVGGATNAIVAAAGAVVITGNATVAQHTTITGLNAAVTSGYSLSDTAGNLVTGTSAVDGAGTVTVTGMATAAQIATIAASYTNTGPDAVYGTDLIYSIQDLPSVFDNANAATLAILNGAATATMVGTAAQVFAGTLTTAERDVADVIIVQDTLSNLGGLTAGQLVEVDRMTVTDTNLVANAATATAVNALVASKPTTYTINGTFANLTAPTGTTAEKAAIATLVMGAANVVVDSNADNALTGADTALTVAQFNTLDGLTNGAIKANITGTVAQLSAADAATAISSAIAASGTVTVSNTAANVSQADTLRARLGDAHSGVTSLVVTDTAANIQAAAAATVSAVNSFIVSDNARITGSTTLLTKVYGADGSSYGNYAISDSATNIVAANTADVNLVKFAQAVTVTGTADKTQANVLGGLTAMGSITYSISDTVANVATTNAAALNRAVNVTATGNADLAQAVIIDGATNSGSTSYAISDAAGTLATSNAAAVGAIERATGTVTATGNATAAQASTLAAFTKAVVYSVSDTPSALAASTGLNEAVNIVSTGAIATTTQAAAIMAATNTGSTTISVVEGAAAEVKALTLGSNDTITSLSVTGTTTVADAAVIAAKDLGANIGTLSFDTVSGSYAEIKANLAAVALATNVTVTGSLTVAQAADLAGLGLGTLSYSITDSLNNIMADTTPGAPVDNAALYVGNNVTVTDTSLTIAQATALRSTGAASYSYSIKDNDANLVAAINSNDAAVAGATSVTSASGTVLTLETIGGQLSVVGTQASLSSLSTVLQGAEKVYEVSVADLAASPDFYIGLNSLAAYRVTDTIANLTSGNALLPNAVALVATTVATVAQATTLNSLGAMTKVYDVTDNAANIAAASGGGSVIDGARNLVVTGTATFAQFNTIEDETNSGTLTVNISDSGANVGFGGANLSAAGNITATGSTTAANAVTLLAAANSGATIIAVVTGTSADLAALTLTANDTITAMTPSDAATVAQLSAMAARAATITAYSLNDSAVNLAGATSAQLNGATNITANTAVTVALATTLDAATNSGTTTFSIEDTADNVLAGSTAVLAADANDEVVISDTTVSAAVATQLRAFDTANADFTIVQGGAAGVFVISDTLANITAAANLAAVQASSDVRVTGTLTIAQADQVRAIDIGDGDGATYDVADTYSRLVAGLATTQEARSVTITNQVTVSQANSAVTNFSVTGPGATLTMNVRDSASAVAAGLAASSAGLAAAGQISVSTSATVAQAAYLSELSASKLIGGYSIADTSANVAAALNTANGTNATDRGTIFGATTITLSDAATVAQALGVRGTESRGIYTIPGISYSITDTASAIIAGLAGSDSAGIDNATLVRLDTNAGILVSQASTLTALANFGGYDGTGAYAVADAFTAVQAADSTLVQNAVSVTADGTVDGETIDMTGIGRGVLVNADAGSDTVFGTDYADTISGGTGADLLTGGNGRDAFAIAGGDSSTAAYDRITDFALASSSWAGGDANNTVAEFQALSIGGVGADVLDLTATGLSVAAGTGTGVAAATYTVTNGILTLSGAGSADVDTLTEWVAEAAAVASTQGETIGFQFNGNTYVFTQNGANDVLVELTAVTGVNGLSLLANSGTVGGSSYIIIG
jgi:hypothetical protein